MKNILVTILTVIAFTAVLVLNIDSNSFILNAKGEESGNKCKWLQVTCPDGTSTYEACVVIGDGNKCQCGLTTRDCPPSQ